MIYISYQEPGGGLIKNDAIITLPCVLYSCMCASLTTRVVDPAAEDPDPDSICEKKKNPGPIFEKKTPGSDPREKIRSGSVE